MIKVRFNKRKFKNLIIIILILIIFFLAGKDYAHALEIVDFTNAYEYNNTLHFQWINKATQQYENEEVDKYTIQNLLNTLKNRNHKYLVEYQNSSANDSFFTSIRVFEYAQTPTLTSSDSSSSYVIFRTNYTAAYYTFDFTCSTYSLSSCKEKVNEQIDKFAKNELSPTGNSNLLIWWWREIETNKDYTSNRQVIYYSNFDLNYNSSKFDIKIGDNIINNNNALITVNDYLNQDPVFNYKIDYSNLKATLTITSENYDTSKYKAYLRNYTDTSNILLTETVYTQDFYNNSYLRLEVYNNNDELINDISIEIKDISLINDDTPYMKIRSYLSNYSFYYDYENIKDGMTCYHFNSWDNEYVQDVNCGTKTKEFLANWYGQNGYIKFEVRDASENVIYNTFINAIYDLTAPYFKFETYIENNKAILNIFPKNFEETDYVKYSNNNTVFSTLNIADKYTYEFYIDMPVYVELYNSNNELKVKGYTFVNANFNNIKSNQVNNANDLLDAFSNLKVSASILEYINVVYNAMSQTPLGTIIFYSFIGVGIVIICYLIKRK